MKFVFISLLFFSAVAYSQKNVFEYKESDFDDSQKIYEMISFINSEMEAYNFTIDKQYNVKMLLERIKIYETISEEILKEQNPDIKKGLMRSIIISEDQTNLRSGIKIFQENEIPENFVQIMKGSLNAMRRMTLSSILEEYNHFLKIKLAEL